MTSILSCDSNWVVGIKFYTFYNLLQGQQTSESGGRGTGVLYSKHTSHIYDGDHVPPLV